LKVLNTESMSYDIILGYRKNLFLMFYVISIVCIGFVIVFLLGYISFVTPVIQLVIGIIIAAAGTIGGAYFSVLYELPSIGHSFDEIKNDIALKKIDSIEKFGNRIVDFICNYFNFAFFSIDYSFIKIKNFPCIYSDIEISKKDIIEENVYENMMIQSKGTENIIYHGIQYIKNSKYHLYNIPIWFGSEYLGYIGILSPNILRKIFCVFLSKFEDEYIDDQLVHVLNYKKANIQK